MKEKILAVLFAFMLALLAACSGSNEPTPEQKKVVAAQKAVEMADYVIGQNAIATQNATFLATQYKNGSLRLKDSTLLVKTDMKLNAECPSGSGWVPVSWSVEMDPDDYPNGKKPKDSIKVWRGYCSTWNPSLGCIMENNPDKDWERYGKKGEDTTCNPGIPTPLRSFK